MEPLIQMNKFEIVDLPGMSTLAFMVEASMEQSSGLSLQKLDHLEIEEEGKIKKTFNVIADSDKQLILLLTLTNNKAIISTGELTEKGFTPVDRNVPLSYGTIFNQEGVEHKEIEYTPNLKRHFSIIDTQTGEEVKPTLYMDDITHTVKGKCKILPSRPYIVLELKLDKNNSEN